MPKSIFVLSMPIIAIVLGLGIIALGIFLLSYKDTPKSTTTDDMTEINHAEIPNTNQNEPFSQASSTEESIVAIKPQDTNTQPEPVISTKPDTEAKPAPTEQKTNPISTSETFSTEVSYRTPETIHHLKITLTVKDDIVTDSSMINTDSGKEYMNNYQKNFVGNYKSQIIGKKLEDISLSRVGGASLTSKAFNNAVAQIIMTNT